MGVNQSRSNNCAKECELVQFTEHHVSDELPCSFPFSIDIVTSIAIHLHTTSDITNLVNTSRCFRQDKDYIYCQWLKNHSTAASFRYCFGRCHPRSMEHALLNINETDRVVLLTNMLVMCVSNGDDVKPISWAVKNGGKIDNRMFMNAVMKVIVTKNKCDVVEYFIAQGIDVNTMDGLAQFMSVYFHNDKMVSILRKSGAEVYPKFVEKSIGSLTFQEVWTYYMLAMSVV
jgi:hypothetical protein